MSIFSSEKWRAFSISQPHLKYASTAWQGPMKMTDAQAQNHFFSLVESNWQSQVTGYTYVNGAWKVGVT